MDYTHEEIIEALKVISNVCANSLDCEECCFGDGNCLIASIEPAKWIINPVQNWKALGTDQDAKRPFSFSGMARARL